MPGKFHGWRSLVGYSPWSHKESDATEQLHFLSFPLYPVPLWEEPQSRAAPFIHGVTERVTDLSQSPLGPGAWRWTTSCTLLNLISSLYHGNDIHGKVLARARESVSPTFLLKLCCREIIEGKDLRGSPVGSPHFSELAAGAERLSDLPHLLWGRTCRLRCRSSVTRALPRGAGLQLQEAPAVCGYSGSQQREQPPGQTALEDRIPKAQKGTHRPKVTLRG